MVSLGLICGYIRNGGSCWHSRQQQRGANGRTYQELTAESAQTTATIIEERSVITIEGVSNLQQTHLQTVAKKRNIILILNLTIAISLIEDMKSPAIGE